MSYFEKLLRYFSWPSGLGNCTVCKRFTVQTILWSPELWSQHHNEKYCNTLNLDLDWIAIKSKLLKTTICLKIFFTNNTGHIKISNLICIVMVSIWYERFPNRLWKWGNTVDQLKRPSSWKLKTWANLANISYSTPKRTHEFSNFLSLFTGYKKFYFSGESLDYFKIPLTCTIFVESFLALPPIIHSLKQ